VLASLGVGPKQVGNVIGGARAYVTRQARGPLFTELPVESEMVFRKLTGEQVLRVGWLDAVALRRAAKLNGFSELVITNLDGISAFPALALATRYLDAAGQARRDWAGTRGPASVRYVRIRPQALDHGATPARVGAILTPSQVVRAWRPFLERVAREVGVPVSRVSASPAGPLVRLDK
jgi:adenylosuccinate synthase